MSVTDQSTPSRRRCFIRLTVAPLSMKEFHVSLSPPMRVHQGSPASVVPEIDINTLFQSTEEPRQSLWNARSSGIERFTGAVGGPRGDQDEAVIGKETRQTSKPTGESS